MPAAVFHGILRTLAQILDAEDGWPASHAGRVALFARELAVTLGVPPAPVYYAGLLHDLGGHGHDEHITVHAERGFTAPSLLGHPRRGAELARACPVLAPIRPLIEAHHERLDGAGFPAGLDGDAVPLGAAILHAADALELALRMAAPAARAATVTSTLERLAAGAVPAAVVDAARATFARLPGLCERAFDPAWMIAAHDEPVVGYPGIVELPTIDLITPLLLLVARMVDARSPRALGRSPRIAHHAFQIACALGPDVVHPWDAAWAGLLHGLGSISIPRRHLDRAPVDDAERAHRQEHAAALVSLMPGLDHLARTVGALHAHHDGTGLPAGLAGERIPLLAQIIAYAATYDALTQAPTPPGALSHPHALDRLRQLVGTVLDPHLAEVALTTLERVGSMPLPALDDWPALFTPRPAGGGRSPEPAPPLPLGRGALMIELEPWQEVELTADLGLGAGREALAALLARPPADHLATLLRPASLAELRERLAAATAGAPGALYLHSVAGTPIEATVVPAPTGPRLLVRSAVNRLQTLDRLAMFYRNFLASSEGVVFADPDGLIIDVNRAFLDLFGYSLREVVGQHTRMLSSGRHSDAFYRQMWSAITDPSGGSWSGEMIDRRRDGREIHVNLRINAVRDAGGACIGYIAHHQDISARKQAEAELERRDAELLRKNAELERLNQFKTDMVAVTSHDLKSPLASIVGVANLLARNLDRIGPERVVAYLDKIADTARRLTTFVNDLLDLERIESGALHLDRVPLHLDELVKDVAEQTRTAALGRIQVDVELPPALPPLTGDPIRLEQVLGNLLANASKFAPDGSAITLGLTRGDDRVRLVVEDRGPGIPAPQLDAVFGRFIQADRKGASKRGSGSGLGLSIVRSLVELHGGRVWAENRDGGGCRFVVELPLPVEVEPMRRPVIVLCAPPTADTLELVEHLAAAHAIPRRVDSLGELARTERILRPRAVVVARSLLDPGDLGGVASTSATPPLRLVLDDTAGDGGATLGADVLTPPILPDEARALVRRALVGAP